MTVAASKHRGLIEVYDVTPQLVGFLPGFLGSPPHHFGSEPLVVPASRGDLTWQAYETFLAASGNRLLRHSFMDGTLELMSPRVFERENTKVVLRRFIHGFTLAKKQPVVTLGTTTLASSRRRLGIEPDEAFRFVRHNARDSGLYRDVDHTGPPELVIEVGRVRHSDSNARIDAVDVDRLALLAQLGVREVWFVNRGKVQIFRNRGQRLVAVERSQFLATVTSPMLSRHLRSRFRIGENSSIAEFVGEALT